MVKKLLLLLLLYSSCACAETIKTDVLVIGGSVSGVSAAIQCARSKVKTILLLPGEWMEDGMPAGNNFTIHTSRNLPSGLWGEFRERINEFYKATPGYDTAYNAPLTFERVAGTGILKKIADTVKNLTIKLNAPFTTIKKDGTGWEISITANGNTDIIKAKVLIDATEKGEVISKAGATLPPVFEIGKNTGELYRTSIATSDLLPNYYIPLQAVIIKDADNLLVTEKILPVSGNMEYLPVQLNLGQGAGTVAAYIAFFKTTTKNLRVRIIQQELLDFKGYLLPFADVKPGDRYIRAVQQIGATGLLKGIQKANDLLFMPNATVTTAEVKPVLTEIYTRAFLWFNKVNPGEKFTVANMVSFISEIRLMDPKNSYLTIQHDWKTKYQFNSDFDLNHPVTRMEFAVLINEYLNPFARTVDVTGNVVN
ncbi:MAG TPA: FAD-dependent oxidoreductase [Mucilaginibacter sp.]